MTTLSMRQELSLPSGRTCLFHSLPALERAGVGRISRLPTTLRIILESLMRCCDGIKVTEDHIRQLASWQPQAAREREIPFCVARILLQDFTGVPVLADLAAMRGAAVRLGLPARLVEPRLPLDLVIDHSVQIDYHGTADALQRNLALEYARNHERYRFIKWGQQAFSHLTVVPPGNGIVHQVNLERLAPPLHERDGVCFPDSLVGTDSHTTMINGLGVVGWGVGGIEAEAAMLGQPVTFLTPDVVGVHLHGKLRAGVSASDLVLHVTRLLRSIGVVGRFVEFCGPGATALSVPDRATLANMAPEYGATVGFFAPDESTVAYLLETGRDPAAVARMHAYLMAQGLFGIPTPERVDYTTVVDLDLASVEVAVAGPKRPQDLIPLPEVAQRFRELLSQPSTANGYGKPGEEWQRRYALSHDVAVPELQSPTGVSGTSATESGKDGTVLRHEVEMVEMVEKPWADTTPTSVHGLRATQATDLGHGDIVIAAITSCTNTSNPWVMCAAGLLASKAVARGLRVPPWVKTSLAPGSRAVTTYLQRLGLLEPLGRLGFTVAAYGCTTCIGNAGPLAPAIEAAIVDHDLVCAAVLSGNRNFEARIHPRVRANFIMGPPLVVAYALAGTIGVDLTRDPLGIGSDGRPVFLSEVWPTDAEIATLLPTTRDPELHRAVDGLRAEDRWWQEITAPLGERYVWEPSTYLAEPPFVQDVTPLPPGAKPIRHARALAIFGDSITTDHISPAGAILSDSPAGHWLLDHGVTPAEFNSYGARRGNHEVMVRGTFANPRIRNRMLPPRDDGSHSTGGFTIHQPSGERMTIFAAAQRYSAQGVPTLVFAGSEYGTGSSRDWAAKGPRLLGVRAVVARSFERIHRSNLIGMGVLPVEFQDGMRVETLELCGDESFDLIGWESLTPGGVARLVIHRCNGTNLHVPVRLRIETPIEAEYLRHDGILPYALRTLLARSRPSAVPGA
ncbi:MAG: aconitate hydratase [Planctomycetes bacterium]|nr:aconitate hydratase [Planctomycetota bacterium]